MEKWLFSKEGAAQAPFLVGLCDKEDRLTKESYHNDSVDEAESCQYNERNKLTKRTVTGDTIIITGTKPPCNPGRKTNPSMGCQKAMQDSEIKK